MARSLLGRLAAALRLRPPPPPPPPGLDLHDVRRRLELLLTAVYGREIPIVTAQPRGEGGLFRRAPGHPRSAALLAGSDGARVHLPPVLEAGDGTEAALARYRLLAVEQAERLARGTAASLPAGTTPLERDLYLLAESAAVDRAIAERTPGLCAAMSRERAAALASRPSLEGLTPAEARVEQMVRALLAADPALPSPAVPGDAGPDASLAWARATAAGLADEGTRYRGLPPVTAWGTMLPLAEGVALRGQAAVEAAEAEKAAEAERAARPEPKRRWWHRSNMGAGAGPQARAGDDDPFAAAGQSAEATKPASSPTPKPGAGAAPGGGAEDLAPTGGGDPAGGVDATEGEVVDAAEGTPAVAEGARTEEGIHYPEWDWRAGQYQRPGALVRPHPAELGDEAWARAVLASQGAVVRRLREQFERLRARRARLTGQRHGDELDLAACVRALVDQRTGHAPDDRLYAAVRPARRELAIALLIDVSGSTHEHVGRARIIDLEKLAVLLAGEAFDALGDRYAVFTFSSRTASNVRMRTVKDFGERNGDAVRRRVTALEPEGFTRMGAAIRHATAQLARQRTGHQLLLIVSDGKPHDDDHYQGTFAVEDARQAVAEARVQGIYPFCLTIDRKGAAYLPRVFGATGHVILQYPEQMPRALTGVVRQLLRS